MDKQVYQNIQRFLLFVTILVLSIALYFEYGQGLKPCPLCLMQRLCTFLFGLFCATAVGLNDYRRAKRIVMFQCMFALSGLYFAARQVWLQSLPADHMPACMPSLDVLMHYFSKTQVLTALFWGSGDCADVSWRLFGFSMPVWSMAYFIGMFLMCGLMFFHLRRGLHGVKQ